MPNSKINAHGFGANTQIKLYDSGVSKRARHSQKVPECYQSLCQIYDCTLDHALKVKSYSLQTDSWSFNSIKKAGLSETNCYMRIWLDRSVINVIECTPSQEFYDVDLQRWVQACQLCVGRHLLRDGSDGYGSIIEVLGVELVSQPLPVYMIEVANDHTFLVTGLNVLTHNMTLEPSLFYAGGGVLANTLSCGAAGSTFGPVGTFAGVLIGGLVAAGASYYFGEWDRVWYKLKYDIGQVAQVFDRFKAYFKDNSESQKQKDKHSIDASGFSSGGDKDPDDDEDKRKSSSYKNVTEAGASRPNVETNVTEKQFKQNLEKGGWDKITSKDGKCDIFTKDGSKYVMRNNAKSTNGPTVDYYKPGSDSINIKIRLGGD